jgi:hypothetical protein
MSLTQTACVLASVLCRTQAKTNHRTNNGCHPCCRDNKGSSPVLGLDQGSLCLAWACRSDPTGKPELSSRECQLGSGGHKDTQNDGGLLMGSSTIKTMTGWGLCGTDNDNDNDSGGDSKPRDISGNERPSTCIYGLRES